MQLKAVTVKMGDQFSGVVQYVDGNLVCVKLDIGGYWSGDKSLVTGL